MRVFFDSSAFAKRYVSEAGTEKVLAWCDQATEIALSAIPLPEIISAFCRLRREGKIDETQYRQLKSMLLADIEDAIHIGAAVALQADVFVSADARQRDAAVKAGLHVEAA